MSSSIKENAKVSNKEQIKERMTAWGGKVTTDLDEATHIIHPKVDGNPDLYCRFPISCRCPTAPTTGASATLRMNLERRLKKECPSTCGYNFGGPAVGMENYIAQIVNNHSWRH